MRDSYCSTVSSWVYAIYQTLNKEGVDGQRILEKCGIKVSDIERPNQRLDLERVKQLWHESVAATGNDAVGLLVIDYLNDKALNALVTATLASANIREAIHRLLRYYRVVSTGFVLEVYEEDSVVIELKKTPNGQFIALEAVDAAFGVITRNIRRLTDSEIRPAKIELMRSVPKQKAVYERFFQCPVLFDSDRNAMSIPLKVMEIEIPNANEMLASYLEQYLSDVLKNLNEIEFSRQVYTNLLGLLPSGTPSLIELASRMNVSERTLQRKLNAENISFKEILCELRVDLAKRYLKEQRYQISEIGYLLGFSAPSNFVRFFKKQVGYSPTQYIKR